MNAHRHEYHVSPTSFYNQNSRLETPRKPSNSLDHRPTTPSTLNNNNSENLSPEPRSQPTSRRRAPHPTLPTLPRFHPANYATTSSSTSAVSAMTSPSTPRSAGISSNLDHINFHTTRPLSPRTNTQLRQYSSDAQRQLYLYHRELLSLNRGSSSPNVAAFNVNAHSGTSPLLAAHHSMLSPNNRAHSPQSPHLIPLASPGGPMTPLILEGEVDQSEGYLLARVGSREAGNHPFDRLGVNEVVDNLIRRETSHAT